MSDAKAVEHRLQHLKPSVEFDVIGEVTNSCLPQLAEQKRSSQDTWTNHKHEAMQNITNSRALILCLKTD